MIDFSADIVSGTSIGNIYLREQVGSVIDCLLADGFTVDITDYPEHPVPSTSYSICSGTIRLTSDTAGTIVAMSCNSMYKGKYREVYHPGMTLAEVLSRSSRLHLVAGVLVVDLDFGAGFQLTEDWDWVDHVSQLPPHLVLDEMFVRERTWLPHADKLR